MGRDRADSTEAARRRAMPGLAEAWRDIPRLRTEHPGTTAYMRARAATEGTGDATGHRWTRLVDVSPYALCAIVGAEDPAFFEHRGIWWSRLALRTLSAVRSGRRIGAVSTITQQLARNLYLHEGRSIRRKLLEMALARRLERVLGKARILELYVNVVEWGTGIWGIEEAARRYFGSSASSLNPFQAVVLASLLPAPLAPLTGRNLARALESQKDQLHFLYSAGVLTLLAWQETSGRLMRLADALRAGHAPATVWQELGDRPYAPSAEIDHTPTVADLLASHFGHRLRAAYVALLHSTDDRRTLMPQLPHRWTGKLAR